MAGLRTIAIGEGYSTRAQCIPPLPLPRDPAACPSRPCLPPRAPEWNSGLRITSTPNLEAPASIMTHESHINAHVCLRSEQAIVRFTGPGCLQYAPSFGFDDRPSPEEIATSTPDPREIICVHRRSCVAR